MASRLNNSAVSAAQNVISPSEPSSVTSAVSSTPRRPKATMAQMTPQSSREHMHLSSSSASLLPSRSRQALMASSSTLSLTTAASVTTLAPSPSSSLLPSAASAALAPHSSAIHPYETHTYTTTTATILPTPSSSPAPTITLASSNPRAFSPAISRIMVATPTPSLQSALSSTLAHADMVLRQLDAEEKVQNEKDGEGNTSGLNSTVTVVPGMQASVSNSQTSRSEPGTRKSSLGANFPAAVPPPSTLPSRKPSSTSISDPKRADNSDSDVEEDIRKLRETLDATMHGETTKSTSKRVSGGTSTTFNPPRSRRAVPAGILALETIDSDDENEQETREVTHMLLGTIAEEREGQGAAVGEGMGGRSHGISGLELKTDALRSASEGRTPSTVISPVLLQSPLNHSLASPSLASPSLASPSLASPSIGSPSVANNATVPGRRIVTAAPPVSAVSGNADLAGNARIHADKDVGMGVGVGDRVLGLGRPLWPVNGGAGGGRGNAGNKNGVGESSSSSVSQSLGSAEALMASCYRELSDESAELANALKFTQNALKQLREDFSKVADSSLKHQANVEKIIEVLTKKDSRLRDRKEKIGNLQGVVATLNNEKRELLVQVTESTKRVNKLEERCQALVAHNAQLHGDMTTASIQAEQMLLIAAKARQEGKEQRAMEKEVGKLQDELQRSKLDLIHLQNKYNNLLRSHTQFEYESSTKIESLTHEVEHRRKDLLRSHEEMVDLQKKHIDLRDEFSNLQQLYNELMSKLGATTAQLHERTTQCTKLEYDLNDLRNLRDAALAKVEASKVDRRVQEDKITSLEGEVDVLRRELESLREALKTATEDRRVAQHEHRRFKAEQSKAVQSTANLRAEFDALSLQYESMKEQYALLSATLEDYKKLTTKLQAESRDFEKVRDAHAFSANELQRLTLKLKELKASSDAQIVSLTDSRDRYLQQVELLRAKNVALNQTVESQKHDLKRYLVSSEKANEELTKMTKERDLLESQLMGVVGEKALAEKNIRKDLVAMETELEHLRTQTANDKKLIEELEEEIKKRDELEDELREKAKVRMGREGLQGGLGLLELHEFDTLNVSVQGPILTPSNNAFVSHGGDAVKATRRRKGKGMSGVPENGVLEEGDEEVGEEESTEVAELKKQLEAALKRAEDAEGKFNSQSLRLAQSEHSVEVYQTQVAEAKNLAEQAQQDAEQRMAQLHKKIAELEAVVSKYRQKSVQGAY